MQKHVKTIYRIIVYIGVIVAYYYWLETAAPIGYLVAGALVLGAVNIYTFENLPYYDYSGFPLFHVLLSFFLNLLSAFQFATGWNESDGLNTFMILCVFQVGVIGSFINFKSRHQ